MASAKNAIIQPPLWLATGPTVARSEIIQPQKCWYHTPDTHTVGILLVIVHHLSSGSDLIIEGSDTLESWTELHRMVGASFNIDYKIDTVGLSASYPLSDGSQVLWPTIRWRWAPSGGTFADQSVCFELQGITKP